MISFGKIEVVNRLRKEFVHETLLNYGVQYDKKWIYDKIHNEINQFYSAQSQRQVYIDMFDQIDVKMKASIRRNFEQMEEERTKVLIAMEKQMVAEKEAETRKKFALAEAEKNATLPGDNKKLKTIWYMAREKSLANANFNKVMKEAEANKLKLTPEYLELRLVLFFSERPQHVILITVGGMKNGALQLMHGELQVLSPLAPIREVNFLRFYKQHVEGDWAVVDVSVDMNRDTSNPQTF
ncbi:hypothetical protein GIB67_035809, partial [Kingdonia uniflora]